MLPAPPTCCRRFRQLSRAWAQPTSYNTCSRFFQEGDIAILKAPVDPDKAPVLTKPLKKDGRTQSHRGVFQHANIIGKEVRSLVRSSSEKDARAQMPTLAEYTVLTPRLVTPIYPGEANLIVSLLDIHVEPRPERSENGGCLEIFEAGTGHGALTLHLARAIHAANGTAPGLKCSDDPVHQGQDEPEHSSESMKEWKSRRRAVIHTLDTSAAHSKHARKIVRDFRRGMYASDVDFHVGDVGAFIEQQRRERRHSAPFLSYVILDLPGVDGYLQTVVDAMNTDATLAVFCPSISQIAECVRAVKSQSLPLALEQVVELGANNAAGKQWEVRAVRPRVAQDRTVRESEDSGGGIVNRMVAFVANIFGSGKGQRRSNLKEGAEEALQMVCRPKTGYFVHGGGFLGLWKRMKS